jgi:hypothetical protein
MVRVRSESTKAWLGHPLKGGADSPLAGLLWVSEFSAAIKERAHEIYHLGGAGYHIDVDGLCHGTAQLGPAKQYSNAAGYGPRCRDPDDEHDAGGRKTGV